MGKNYLTPLGHLKRRLDFKEKEGKKQVDEMDSGIKLPKFSANRAEYRCIELLWLLLNMLYTPL